MAYSAKQCKTCGSWFPTSRHKCPPEWECRLEDGEDIDINVIHADDAEHAAEKFAESYDCEGGDYGIIRRGSATVCVRSKGEETFAKFDVQAESRPHYSAYEIKKEEDNDGPAASN